MNHNLIIRNFLQNYITATVVLQMSNASCSCPNLRKVLNKRLGVIMDQRLSWYQHLESIINRVSKLTWIFKPLRPVVPRVASGSRGPEINVLNEIYISLAQSILLYCLPIWVVRHSFVFSKWSEPSDVL